VDDRRQFLLEMYRQMFNDINRHITVIWQSVGVVVGALAIFALAEKGVLSVDFASTIVILLCFWLFSHVVDGSYWYNRNLAIIANIERQFLVKQDLREIHYYFGEHRPENRMITQFKHQAKLGIGLAAIVLYYHFSGRVWQGLFAPISNFEPVRALPYVTAVVCLIVGWSEVIDKREKYAEFLKHSPGIAVDTSDITYGAGHGFGASIWKRIFTRKKAQT
jgi:hypothetical protein